MVCFFAGRQEQYDHLIDQEAVLGNDTHISRGVSTIHPKGYSFVNGQIVGRGKFRVGVLLSKILFVLINTDSDAASADFSSNIMHRFCFADKIYTVRLLNVSVIQVNHQPLLDIAAA